MDEQRPYRPPRVPELGSEEARERIRRSGVPLDEWEPWPPSAERRAQWAAERRSEERWYRGIIAVVVAIAIAILIWSVTTSDPAPAEGDACQDDRGAFIC